MLNLSKTMFRGVCRAVEQRHRRHTVNDRLSHFTDDHARPPYGNPQRKQIVTVVASRPTSANTALWTW
jgi:hypothetical protein